MWGCGVRLDRDTSQAITSAPCVTAATSTCAGSRRAHFVSATSASAAVGAATRQATCQPLKGERPSFRADEHPQVGQLLGATDEQREQPIALEVDPIVADFGEQIVRIERYGSRQGLRRSAQPFKLGDVQPVGCVGNPLDGLAVDQGQSVPAGGGRERRRS